MPGQDGIGAQDACMPSRTLLAQHISQVGIQVAQVFTGADPHSIRRIGDDPSPGFRRQDLREGLAFQVKVSQHARAFRVGS